MNTTEKMYALMYNDHESNLGSFYGCSSIKAVKTLDGFRCLLDFDYNKIKSKSKRDISDIEKYLSNKEHFNTFLGVKVEEDDTNYNTLQLVSSISSWSYSKTDKHVISVERFKRDDDLFSEVERLRKQIAAIDTIFAATSWEEVFKALPKIEYNAMSLIPLEIVG